MTQNNPFEIPEQLRQLAEQSVEQARNTYGQFMDAMLQAQNMWFSSLPGNSAVDGFKEVQDLGMQFARENADNALNLATELSKAKDLTEIIAIQSRYAQTQMQRFAAQGQQMAQTISQFAQHASSHNK